MRTSDIHIKTVLMASCQYPALAAWQDIRGLPQLLSHLQKCGWVPYIVGEWVRDAVMGLRAREIDIECYDGKRGIDELELCVGQVVTDVERKGGCFGTLVVYLPGYRFPIRVLLPRRGVKSKKDERIRLVYDAQTLPYVSSGYKAFTVDTLMYDPDSDILYDFCGGIRDLQEGVLRHISPVFKESPIQALRGFYLCGCLGLSPARETVEICREMRDVFSSLAKEKIGSEFVRWASRSFSCPSAGLRFLQETGWAELFPPLAQMMNVACNKTVGQSMWDCVARGVDTLARTLKPESQVEKRVSTMLAILSLGMMHVKAHRCDMCSAHNLSSVQERIDTKDDSIVGFWVNLGISKGIAQRISRLACTVPVLPETRADVRFLSAILPPATIEEWHLVTSSIYSDFRERKEKIAYTLTVAQDEGIVYAPTRPIVTKAMLLSQGFEQGAEINRAMRDAYIAQLMGEFTSTRGAIRWINEYARRRKM